MQDIFNLSDEAEEDQIRDRLSFQEFLSLNPAIDDIPDSTTLCLLRQNLDKYSLREKIFKYITQKLEHEGYLLKKGTVVDATIIASPSSTKMQIKREDE